MPTPFSYSNNLPYGTFNGFWIHKRDFDGDVIVDSYSPNPDPNALINGQTIAEYNATPNNNCNKFNLNPADKCMKTIGGEL